MFMLDLIFEHVKDNFGSLPRNLFLVFDSCSVNKCRKLFSFLSSFVAYSVFDEIQIIYLPVGHTHWFNDQIFSIVARKFHRTSCCIQSIGEFEKYLKTCYQPAWFKLKEKLKPVTERTLFQSHVRQLEAIPDYTMWCQNFMTSNFKNFPVQGRNRFEFFRVDRPNVEGVSEVQINGFVNSFSVEQNIQTYYSTSVHGIFGNLCLDRVERGYQFVDTRVAQLFIDFYSQINQPIAHVVLEFWPDLTDNFLRRNPCDSLPSEDFKILNLNDVLQIVSEADYNQDVVDDWQIRVFDKLQQREEMQCPECQLLQIKDAEVHIAGRHRGNAEEKDAVDESRKLRDEIRIELQNYLMSENHVSWMKWNFLTRLRNFQGNENKFDAEDFERFLRSDASQEWNKKLFQKIGMFSNVALVEKRLSDMNIQDSDYQMTMEETHWKSLQNISSFFLGIRGWHIQDGNTFWDHVGPQDILSIFKKYHSNLDEMELDSIPQFLHENIRYLQISDARLDWRNSTDYMTYITQLSTHRLSRPYLLKASEMNDLNLNDDWKMSDVQIPNSFQDMGWVSDYSFLYDCEWGAKMRAKLFRLNALTDQEKQNLIGKAIFTLTPGNIKYMQRHDGNLSRVSHPKPDEKWWRKVVPDTVFWNYQTQWRKPVATSRSMISQNIMVFLVLGFHDQFVFGHWMITEQNARTQSAESCWKRRLIPTAVNKTPGFVIEKGKEPPSVIPWAKKGHLISCFEVSILENLLLWTNPFELIPVHSMDNLSVPSFSIPIRIIPILRNEWGWRFVYDVFKM